MPIKLWHVDADLRATLALNKSTLSCAEEGVAPRRQPVRGNAEVPGDGLQALSADEPLDGGRLALRRYRQRARGLVVCLSYAVSSWSPTLDRAKTRVH